MEQTNIIDFFFFISRDKITESLLELFSQKTFEHFFFSSSKLLDSFLNSNIVHKIYIKIAIICHKEKRTIEFSQIGFERIEYFINAPQTNPTKNTGTCIHPS